jgi:CRISPR-associated protein Cas2
MTIFVLIAVPPGLRGHLTRWLLEIAPGVFVGTVTARVRDHLWRQVQKYLGPGGRAVMVHPAPNEQGMSFRVAGEPWEPIDLDGLTLIRRSTLGTPS